MESSCPPTHPFGSIVRAISAGDGDADVLRRKRHDVLTVRAKVADGSSVIVKLWDRRGLRAVVRRMTGTSAPRREWDALTRLQQAGVFAPRPLARIRLAGPVVRHTDAIVMEDLGRVTRVADLVKGIVRSGDIGRLRPLEDAVVGITQGMVNGGVLDEDHSLMNHVLTPDGRVARLDLEVARCVRPSGRCLRLRVAMLERLVVTHFFIVFPRTELTRAFADRLAEAIRPSARLLRVAGSSIRSRVHDFCRQRNVNPSEAVSW